MGKGALSESQFAVIRTLIDTAPDSAIRSLDMALMSEPHAQTAMSAIRDMVSLEAGERRARSMVFAPFLALCPRNEPDFEHQTFPARTLKQLWSALKAAAPTEVQQAMSASIAWSDEAEAPEIFDQLCALAAEGLASPAGTPYAELALILDEEEEGSAEDLAGYLALSALARNAQANLPDWLGRMTPERAAAVRLAFKDADAIAEDATPRLLELMIGGMEQPWEILRVVSALLDRPTDKYLASSELAHVGDRLLADIDRRIDDMGAFDPFGGAAAGLAAANAVCLAVAEVFEFEQSINLQKDGPWGKRIARQKQLLAQKVESVMGKTDEAVGAALPLKPSKGKAARGVPSFRNAADARAVAKAEGMLTFFEQARSGAAHGGYASLRTKTLEKLNDRFDHYVEDVLDHLRTPDAEDGETAREFLDIAANLIACYRDEGAAQIVRRRAAA